MAAASTPGNEQTAASPVHQRVVLGVEHMPQLSRRFSTASLPPNQAAKAAGLHMYSEQAKPTQAIKQHRKTIHSQHTGQHSVGLHRRTSRIPAQPKVPLGPHCRHYCQKRFPQKEFQHKIAKEKLPPNLPQPPQCKLTYKLCRSEKPTMCSCV